jgi:hypothetical protein
MALLASLLASSAAAQTPPAPWPEAQVNPRAAAEDMLLPLPCGGAMAFRKIATPAPRGALADRQAVVGDEDAETAYAEFVRTDFLAGPFVDPQGVRHFWIGKYEVTRAQYVAVTAGCEDLAGLGGSRRAPQTGLGWFEAVRFAHLFGAWLAGNARDKLPGDGKQRAFVRLPTEVEWEFAARGGAAVSDADFRRRVHPMDGPVHDYAQISRPGGRRVVRDIGLLKPNPLGIHDMLGNAEEIVLDAFRLNRGGRLHGQAGGFVAKGGDVMTPEDRLRSAMRIEYPHFDSEDGKPTALPTAGLRVVLALPVISDLARGPEIRAEWERELEGQRRSLEQDPAELAQKMVLEVTTPAQRTALERLRQAIVADRFARAEADRRAMGSAIGTAAVLIRVLRVDTDQRNTIANALSNLQTRSQLPPAERQQMMSDARERLEVIDFRLRTTTATLASLILRTGQDYTQDPLKEQAAAWKAENPGPERAALRDFADWFLAEVAEVRPRRSVDEAKLRERMMRAR